MNQFTKILFFVFLSHISCLISHVSFAQTDTLAPINDTLASQLPVADTLSTIDTLNPAIDTSFNNTGQENKSADTIFSVPVIDTNLAATIDTVQKIDTALKPVPPKKIVAQFDTFPVIFKQGEIISKTLQVINGTEKEFTFSINITYPGAWKLLTNSEKIYSLEPGDTFFIPIRIVPHGKIQGNTKYLIYAYIINEKNVPITSDHFLAEKQKTIKWDMNVNPGEKIYIVNDEYSADFSINVFNSGNEKIELTLDMSNYRKDRLALMDTNERILKKPFFTFNLLQEQDTNFYFRAKFTQGGIRNFRLIDTENYLPNNNQNEAQKYSIFARSRESTLSGKGSIFKGKKIDLIRLPDNTRINQYNSRVLPVIMDVNFLNILTGQPIMNLMFRGSTFLKNGAMLNYFSQTYFSTYFANIQWLTNSFFNVGYYTQKFNVQVGSIGGGKGISGGYVINQKNSIGAFFSRSSFLKAGNTSYGLNYTYVNRKFRANTNYSQHFSPFSNQNFYYLLNNLAYNFSSKHVAGFGINLFRLVSTDPLNPFTKDGYSLNANYSGIFFNDRLQSGIGGSYSPSNFSGFFGGASRGITLSNNLKVNKNLKLQLINDYQHVDPIVFQPARTLFYNSLQFQTSNKKINVVPSLFYNISNIGLNRFHSRGLSIGYSNFDYETNRMAGITLRAGYNKDYYRPEIRDYFFLQSFFVFRYRVWSGNIRYTYGSIAASDLSFLNGTYPQSIGMSLNNQYQFRNPHFVLNNNFTYNHINLLRKHSFGYTPYLYYFTNSGWRFYVSPGYYFSISKSINANRLKSNSQELTEPKPVISQNIILNAGIRKEFGIPIPWIKTKYPTLTFKAFIDHDGNNKQDVGEVELENVVVKLGEWETLTNEKGLVTFRNIFGDSTYSFTAFSLVDLKGYFPNIPSSIIAVKDSLMFIPFVKGVKVHGNVYLDREKITPGVEKSIDLTGIKITALNGKAIHTLTDGKGDFSFYVPFGKYTISMDEKVLGDRFTLLQNNIELELDQKTESIFLTFYIVEKRRKITVKKFNGNGERIKDSDTTITPKPKTLEELQKEEELKKQKEGLSPGAPGKGADKKGQGGKEKVGKGEGEKQGKGTKPQSSNEPIDKSQIKFKVQIGAYGSDVPNDIVEKIKSMPDVKESMTDEGLMRYTAGEFSDYESAQALRQELINKGISSDTTFVIIIADYKGRVFSADEAKELLKD